MLTVYECPNCGTIAGQDHLGGCTGAVNGWRPVRVFREEDVRLLHDAAVAVRDAPVISDPPAADAADVALERALDAFPAPDDWDVPA